MMGDIFLSTKEARRVFVIEKAARGEITVREASMVLGLSERQVKRLKKGFAEAGPAALAHKNRGRPPHHTVPEALKKRIVALATGDFRGASHRHMAELLPARGIHVGHRTITRILKEAGIENQYTGRRTARRRRSRDRVPQEGLLVQADASRHDWLEGRGPWLTLHAAIDDATGKILGLYFRPNEDIVGYLHVLRQMARKHGLPRSLYTDRHTMFVSPNGKLTLKEELAGKRVPLTQLGRVLDDLGINHIRAFSPQAKGRVERLWGTLQGRLVIELRQAQVSTIEQANAFLGPFRLRFNKRFSVAPVSSDLAFSTAPSNTDLDRILTTRLAREATNGSTISYLGRTYQMIGPHGVAGLKPKAEITVLKHLNGSLSALYRGKPYRLKHFTAPARQELPAQPMQPRKPSGHPQPASHPWKQSYDPRRRSYDPVAAYFREKDPDYVDIYAQR